MHTDSPDLVIAKQLLDQLKARGFEFQRAGPGEDDALVGHRMSDCWLDLVHVEGFSRDCFAWRTRTSSLIVPGSGLIERQADGGALHVLNEVLTWQGES